MAAQGERVAVALGAGGARGYAHIGALQVLRERGYEVVALAGTSMGALVGGVTAAGVLEPYTEWALSLTQRDVFRLLDPTLSGGGAIRAERVIGKVAEFLQGARIEDLPVPFTAVATDLGARREVWFQRGLVSTAIRASVAIPGVVTPIVVDGRVLVDGGLMNPVPIEPTAAVTADWVFAVNLTGPRTGSPVPVGSCLVAAASTSAEEAGGDPLGSSSPVSSESVSSESRSATRRGAGSVGEPSSGASGEGGLVPPTGPAAGSQLGTPVPPVSGSTGSPVRTITGGRLVGEWGERLRASAAGVLESEPVKALSKSWATFAESTLGDGGEASESGGPDAANPPAPYAAAPKELGTFEIFNRSFDTMASLITRYRMASNPPDVLVTVPSDACRTMDFHRAADMIALGRRLTIEALDAAGR